MAIFAVISYLTPCEGPPKQRIRLALDPGEEGSFELRRMIRFGTVEGMTGNTQADLSETLRVLFVEIVGT